MTPRYSKLRSIIALALALAFATVAVVEEVASFQLPPLPQLLPALPTTITNSHGSLVQISSGHHHQQWRHHQQIRHHEYMCPIVLFSSTDDENEFSDFDEDIGAAAGGRQQQQQQPKQQQQSTFQTEGGVIMPEGGANPCVIKVTAHYFYSCCP